MSQVFVSLYAFEWVRPAELSTYLDPNWASLIPFFCKFSKTNDPVALLPWKLVDKNFNPDFSIIAPINLLGHFCYTAENN